MENTRADWDSKQMNPFLVDFNMCKRPGGDLIFISLCLAIA